MPLAAMFDTAPRVAYACYFIDLGVQLASTLAAEHRMLYKEGWRYCGMIIVPILSIIVQNDFLRIYYSKILVYRLCDSQKSKTM